MCLLNVLQVGYATALDVFIVICFVMVFAALMEFAFLNFLDTLVRRLKKKEAEKENVNDEDLGFEINFGAYQPNEKVRIK